MKKRGVSIIVPLVMIVLVLALVAGMFIMLNKPQAQQSPLGQVVINLEEEIGVEDLEIGNYGTFKGLEQEQIKNLLEGFIESYSEIENVEEVYFIYGTYKKLTIMNYKKESGGQRLVLAKGDIKTKEYSRDKEEDIVIVGGEEHKFNLEENESFYFILMKTAEGEKEFKGESK